MFKETGGKIPVCSKYFANGFNTFLFHSPFRLSYRGIVLMGGSSDYGLSPDEVLARESLLSYFEDLIKRTGPLRLNGPELMCHLQDRLEDSDSLLIGRGAESLSEADNFGAFLSTSPDLILVDDYVCAIIDETKTKSMALTDILSSYVPTPVHVSQPTATDKPPTTTLCTSTNNPFGAIGSSPPAAISSLPANNVWKSGPPSIIGNNYLQYKLRLIKISRPIG